MIKPQITLLVSEIEADLILAALNYCHHCQPMVDDHLRFHGHPETADHTIYLDKLRCHLSSEIDRQTD